MTKKKQKIIIKNLKKLWPYILTAVVTLTLVFVGSLDKKDADTSLSLNNFARNNYNVSVDQISALYVVADISDSFNLASASDVASNYVVTTSMRSAGQTSTDKLEKPNLTNISVSRGVITYEVGEGDSMESIAQRYGISTDQIRWSNGKKTTDVSVGDVLYLPSTGGIVYTVKSGDTIDDIVSRYGSSVAEIIALNDLEISGISEGMRILIKNGSLPETERPEYVAPVRHFTYTYLGNTSSRQNVSIVARGFYDANYAQIPYGPNPGARGYCTWYAWYWRATSPLSLGRLGPEGGHARTWNRDYANSRGVGNTPAVGAVFQTPYGGGGYGHVGVVVAVNEDGSILVREMNYGEWEMVTEATIPANQVGNFNYIY